ncbi:MAG: MurR/RpiR family transcriptional regulator, partial [Polymorphobacter sp.]
ANFLLENMAGIPFETAASIGARVGVSAMTVGRFLKSLGYLRLSALKQDLRHGLGDAPWLLQPASAAGLDERLRAETAALAEVYRLATTAEWQKIAALLTAARQIYVAGFQSERGLAMGFASQLAYVRPGVRLIDSESGIFSEIIAEASGSDVLVLIDIRRYSQHFRKLAERARQRRIPVVVITDPYCPWARDLSPHVLTAEVSFGHFWDMNSALGSLLNLLVDDVVRLIGEPQVHARLALLSEAYEDFIGFQGRGGLTMPPRSARARSARPARPAPR